MDKTTSIHPDPYLPTKVVLAISITSILSITVLGVVAMFMLSCATVVPTGANSRQELMVTKSLDGAYLHGQSVCRRLQATPKNINDMAHTFDCTRATGEVVLFQVERLALGSLVTIRGQPAHDVSDFVLAYQH